MEELGGAANRLRHQRNPPLSDRILGTFSQQPTSPMHPIEFSEHDIFNTPSGSPSSSPTQSGFSASPTRNVQNHNRGHYGILAALSDNLKTRSGSGTQPVFNHKASAPASASASLSSSSSTSPAMSSSSRVMIPKRPPPPPPPVDGTQLRYQSAPVNVPAGLLRRARDLDDVEEEDEIDGVMLPPHEVVAARHSPILANSVLEGAGRTLKGRDLRQVRNAIWRKTGFLD